MHHPHTLGHFRDLALDADQVLAGRRLIHYQMGGEHVMLAVQGPHVRVMHGPDQGDRVQGALDLRQHDGFGHRLQEQRQRLAQVTHDVVQYVQADQDREDGVEDVNVREQEADAHD